MPELSVARQEAVARDFAHQRQAIMQWSINPSLDLLPRPKKKTLLTGAISISCWPTIIWRIATITKVKSGTARLWQTRHYARPSI
jgi:hypothetical protein